MTRRLIGALLLVCLFLALGLTAERLLVKVPSVSLQLQTPTHRDSRADSTGTATLLEFEGSVEHMAQGEVWRELRAGDSVRMNEEIRTGPNSRARLQLGSQVTIELADNTGINIAQLSSTLSRIRLQDGRVVSDVQPASGFVFRVQVQANGGCADASDGRFAVLKRSPAPAVFAAERGSVVVTGAGQSVALHEGEQTLVKEGGAPSAPTKLPSSLLLKLGRPPQSRLRERHTRITGQTSAGAVVIVQDAVIVPNESGVFSDTVALVDGLNEIRVHVEDVAGRRQTANLPKITVDARPPTVAGKVVW